ncbi:MAG: hypothetical protein ACI9W2_003735 [Gammaproteobacteria bacterium]|jgi:uncharacterized protein (TIGR02246 family)
MSDIDDVKATIDEWNSALDDGDVERMVATCDPEAVTCNERQPTTVGAQAVRNKYAPRIAAASIKSGFDCQHVRVYGDMAIMVGHFTGEMTDKASGEIHRHERRLVLVYRRHDDESWKMILDLDNNAA